MAANIFFHHECVQRWSNTENTCPQCKIRFFWLASYSPEGQRQTLTRVRRRDQEGEEDETYEDLQVCEKCKQVGDEASLLLCDGMHGTCNAAYHCACVGLSSIPRDSWFCQDCVERGFDIDAQGRRGNTSTASCSSMSRIEHYARPAAGSSPDGLSAGAGQAPSAAQTAETTMQLAREAVAASAARRHRNSIGSTTPPQLRLSSLACLTPAAEVPSFRVGNTAQQGSDTTPPKEGIFATFAARRRAQRRGDVGSAQQASTPSFSLSPAYEEDFMGKSVQ